jgi:hypothetical protein
MLRFDIRIFEYGWCHYNDWDALRFSHWSRHTVTLPFIDAFFTLRSHYFSDWFFRAVLTIHYDGFSRRLLVVIALNDCIVFSTDDTTHTDISSLIIPSFRIWIVYFIPLVAFSSLADGWRTLSTR